MIMMLYLLTYDIANPKRLGRLYRAMKKRAVPIQYSVFLARLTPARLADMRSMVLSIIDEREDDVRFYPLPTDGWQRRLGRTTLPAGLLLTMLPEGFRARQAGEQPAPGPLAQASRPATRANAGRSARAVKRQVQTGQRRGIMLI
jgi:CRISPR-associated protein Cas2